MAVTAWWWWMSWALAAGPQPCGDPLQVRWKDIEAQPGSAVVHSLRCARDGAQEDWAAIHVRALTAWGEEDLAWRRLGAFQLSEGTRAVLTDWLQQTPAPARTVLQLPRWAEAASSPVPSSQDAVLTDAAFWTREAPAADGRREAVLRALQAARQQVWAGRFGAAEVELQRAALWARLGGMDSLRLQAQLELVPLLLAWGRHRELDQLMTQLHRHADDAGGPTPALLDTLALLWKARDGDPIGAAGLAMGLQEAWERHADHRPLQGVRHLWEAQHAEALRDVETAREHWKRAAEHLDGAGWAVLAAFARAEAWAMDRTGQPLGAHDAWPGPLHLASRIGRDTATGRHAYLRDGLPALLEQWRVQGADWQADGWVRVALAGVREEGEGDDDISSGVRLLALADEDLEDGSWERAMERYEASEHKLQTYGVSGLGTVVAERMRWARLMSGGPAASPPGDDPWTLPWVLPWLLDVDGGSDASPTLLRQAAEVASAADLHVMAARLTCALGSVTGDPAERAKSGKACVWLQPDLGLSLVLTGAQRLSLQGRVEEARGLADWLSGWPTGPLDETMTLRRSLSTEDHR